MGLGKRIAAPALFVLLLLFVCIAGFICEAAEEGAYAIAENEAFSMEYPADRVCQDADGALFVSMDGSESDPLYFIEKSDTLLSTGEYIVERKSIYEQTFRDRMATMPEIITVSFADTGRSAAGFKAAAASLDGSRILTRVELAEEIGGSIYHYYCCYVSLSYTEDVALDETTYNAFLHSIESLTVFQ